MPTAVLAVVALHERFPRTAISLPPLMLAATSASAVLGLVLGVTTLGIVRRHADLSPSVRTNALFGALASAFVLVVVVAADLCGAAAMREAQSTLEATTTAALRDTPGWNGGAMFGPTNIVASSLDRRSQASKVMTHPFDRALHVMVLTVDNRAGDHDVVVDLDSVHVRVAGGAVHASLSRAQLLAYLKSGEDPSHVGAGAVRVSAGDRLDRGAQAFFDEDVAFRDVEAVELRVDGAPLLLQGRYFTVAEKRAIDARVR